MLPDRVSNPGPLTYESGALSIALRGPANIDATFRTYSSADSAQNICLRSYLKGQNKRKEQLYFCGKSVTKQLINRTILLSDATIPTKCTLCLDP